MKRKQPVEKQPPPVGARRRSARLAPKKQKAPPTNLSSSSSSSSVASMPKRKSEGSPSRSSLSTHGWKKEEEFAMLEEIKELLRTTPYSDNITLFHEIIASTMNQRFQGDNYVGLTSSKIRSKLQRYQESWLAGIPVRTTEGNEIINNYDDMFKILFRKTKGTRSVHRGGAASGAVSGGDAATGSISMSLMQVANTELARQYEKEEHEIAERKRHFQAATKFMTDNGCEGVEMLIFTALLGNSLVLNSFEPINGYASKRSHLIKCWKSGIVRVDDLPEAALRNLPEDMQ